MADELTRRSWLALGPAAALAGSAAGAAENDRPTAPPRPADEPFGYCLNTSTISGQKLPLAREAELAAAAGFQAIEPWVRELEEAEKGGGLAGLDRRFRDLGLTVESAIGFFDWVVDDDARRRKGLEDAERSMDLVRRVGGTRIAAPPVGATDRDDLDPARVADRYRALLELGDRTGVVPQVEVWGFSKTLGTLADATRAAVAADHPSACVLADIFHLYKGGSGFHGLRLLSGEALHVIHLNDYPADPPRDRITDADRVYPGDGVAPLGRVFRDLRTAGFRGFLSVELFNRAYWKLDAEVVLKTALAKLRAAVKAGLGEPAGR